MVACSKLQVYKEPIIHLCFQFQHYHECLEADWEMAIANKQILGPITNCEGSWVWHRTTTQRGAWGLTTNLHERLWLRQILHSSFYVQDVRLHCVCEHKGTRQELAPIEIHSQPLGQAPGVQLMRGKRDCKSKGRSRSWPSKSTWFSIIFWDKKKKNLLKLI